jgi:hypothetical protein
VVAVRSDVAEGPGYNHNLAEEWMAAMAGIQPECMHLWLVLLSVCTLIARQPGLGTREG